MKVYGKISIVFLGLSLATLGSSLSTWASNAAIVFAIIYSSNQPAKVD
jgi:hypothetical protein